MVAKLVSASSSAEQEEDLLINHEPLQNIPAVIVPEAVSRTLSPSFNQDASLPLLSGANAGRKLVLTKAFTTIGKS
jgi:hypothetical protein